MFKSSFIIFILSISLCYASIEPTPQLQTNLRQLDPGNSLSISSITGLPPFLSFFYNDSGPRMIFSDDPEYLSSPGICAQETIGNESVRLYLYNVNNTSTNLFKFAIVLKNLSNQTGQIVITKRSIMQPGTNYNYIGKMGLLNFYNSNVNNEITIPPNESVLLDPFLETATTRIQYLAHGFYEFHSYQSTRVTLCGLNYNDNTLQTYETLSILSANSNNAGRGLYSFTNRNLNLVNPVNTVNGIQKIRLADGNNDPWVIGVDGTTGEIKNLVGNYGILYTVNIPMRSTDNRDMAIIIMSGPAGIGYCNYVGAMGTETSYNQKPAGYFLTPSDLSAFINPTTASLIGIYSLSSATSMIKLQYSPPGSSCLPVDLILIPLEKLNCITDNNQYGTRDNNSRIEESTGKK